jgi:hypothetical protein
MVVTLALFAVLGVAMLAVGSAQPLNPSLRGFVEGCEGTESLCWYGINELTRLETAQEILTREGYSLTNHAITTRDVGSLTPQRYFDTYERPTNTGCNRVQLVYVSGETNPEVDINFLENCQGLYVEDVMHIFGEPHNAVLSQNIGMLLMGHKVSVLFLGRNPQPYSAVKKIWGYHAMGAVLGRLFDWRGFIPTWRYCFSIPVDECLSL